MVNTLSVKLDSLSNTGNICTGHVRSIDQSINQSVSQSINTTTNKTTKKNQSLQPQSINLSIQPLSESPWAVGGALYCSHYRV